jgi:hypothetical protein
MNPPDNALVLSVDEKTQIQALDRTQPVLQLRPGQIERRTHDSKRYGTRSLYAALNTAAGQAIGQVASRHRAKKFMGFLRKIDRDHFAHRGQRVLVLQPAPVSHEWPSWVVSRARSGHCFSAIVVLPVPLPTTYPNTSRT